MKETILNVIFLILNSSKGNEEISQIIGGISSYTVMQYRRMMGLKKFSGKTAETMTESNLKEFYSLLQMEGDTLKKFRHLVMLMLTTNKSNKEICEIIGLSPIFVRRIRHKLLHKRCDWQKFKAMSDFDFKKLLREKCPCFTKKYFPDINFIQPKVPKHCVDIQNIWKEYRQAYQY